MVYTHGTSATVTATTYDNLQTNGVAIGATTASTEEFTTLETSDNLSVAMDKRVNLEGSAGDTYAIYNSTKGRLELFVNGGKVAWLKE